MSVEQAIIEVWSAYKPLTALVAATRAWKGTVPQGTAKPYISLLIEDPESTRTSSNTYTQSTLRMNVYADTEVEAERIVNEVKEHFDGLETTWSRGTILDCKFQGTVREEDDEDATWWLSTTFMVQVQEARRSAGLRR